MSNFSGLKKDPLSNTKSKYPNNNQNYSINDNSKNNLNNNLKILNYDAPNNFQNKNSKNCKEKYRNELYDFRRNFPELAKKYRDSELLEILFNYNGNFSQIINDIFDHKI